MSSDPFFEAFPKIARLSRECVITEKIDGTNAQILITPDGQIHAGSRTRMITVADDNYGFARWVNDNAEALISGLGEGRHFGEWWGSGIQRRYALEEKRFSLFNTRRWQGADLPEGVFTVPVLFQGEFHTDRVMECLDRLKCEGSVCSPDLWTRKAWLFTTLRPTRCLRKLFTRTMSGKAKIRKE